MFKRVVQFDSGHQHVRRYLQPTHFILQHVQTDPLLIIIIIIIIIIISSSSSSMTVLK